MRHFQDRGSRPLSARAFVVSLSLTATSRIFVSSPFDLFPKGPATHTHTGTSTSVHSPSLAVSLDGGRLQSCSSLSGYDASRTCSPLLSGCPTNPTYHVRLGLAVFSPWQNTRESPIPDGLVRPDPPGTPDCRLGWYSVLPSDELPLPLDLTFLSVVFFFYSFRFRPGRERGWTPFL